MRGDPVKQEESQDLAFVDFKRGRYHPGERTD